LLAVSLIKVRATYYGDVNEIDQSPMHDLMHDITHYGMLYMSCSNPTLASDTS